MASSLQLCCLASRSTRMQLRLSSPNSLTRSHMPAVPNAGNSRVFSRWHVGLKRPHTHNNEITQLYPSAQRDNKKSNVVVKPATSAHFPTNATCATLTVRKQNTSGSAGPRRSCTMAATKELMRDIGLSWTCGIIAVGAGQLQFSIAVIFRLKAKVMSVYT